jgi:hypothetical protein
MVYSPKRVNGKNVLHLSPYHFLLFTGTTRPPMFSAVLVRTDNALSIALTKSDLEKFDGRTVEFVTWLQNFNGELPN